jgi:hypothetical protein
VVSFIKHLRRKQYQSYTNISRKLKRKKYFPTHSMRPVIKTSKKVERKENDLLLYIISKEAQIFITILSTYIQENVKKAMHSE